MNWQLIEVTEDVPCTMDDSGIYTVINRVVETETHKQHSGERVRVRVDVMTVSCNVPIQSFTGYNPNAVRKAVIRFIPKFLDPALGCIPISIEHASYIGYEIHRAFTDPQFVQD